jgi:site-specific recombinase XerD
MNKKLPAVRAAAPTIIRDFAVPTLVTEAGSSARYAWEEFLYGEIENVHTRRAYGKAVSDLLSSAEKAGLSLSQISPKFVRQHFERMKSKTSTPTRKLRLSAVKRFFDIAVTRHAMPLNPALSVRGEKYSVTEGKTSEISTGEVAKLLKRCDESTVIGLRDKTIIALMAFTAARVNAVSMLCVGDFAYKGNQWVVILAEKGGKSREIPVRHDLELLIKKLILALGSPTDKDPLFPTAVRRSGRFTDTSIHPNNVRDMLKKRLLAAGLPTNYTPHSFRVCTLTDLLKQDVAREDVQYLAGHADARTTALYDRRSKKVTRNIVERISIKLS